MDNSSPENEKLLDRLKEVWKGANCQDVLLTCTFSQELAEERKKTAAVMEKLVSEKAVVAKQVKQRRDVLLMGGAR